MTIDINYIPANMTHLMLGANKISEIFFKNLPFNMQTLDLSENPLVFM